MINSIVSAFRFLFLRLPTLVVWHWPFAGVSAALRGVLWCLRWVYAGICAQGRLLRASPLAFYRAMCRRRDWLMAKVDYLNSESGKWRALFATLRLPYSGLRAMGINPQTCVGILVAGGTVGGGVIVNETVFAERSFSRGDSGTYSAPADIPIVYSDENNTLLIRLGSTPIGEITIQDVSVGTAFSGSTLPSGETAAVLVGGVATSTGFTATWLEVGHLIVDRWRCNTFELSDVEVHTLTVRGNASDGQSIGPTPGTPRRRAIGGGNRADSMVTEGGTYDQIQIIAPNSAVNGKVDVLTLSNLFTKGGACKLSRIKAGKIDILLNETGLGNGYASKEFVIATSTVYSVFVNTDNREVSISPP